MLYLIGLGLDKNDLSIKAVEAIKKCKKVYLERPMGNHVVSSLVALIKHRLATIYKIDEYEKIK